MGLALAGFYLAAQSRGHSAGSSRPRTSADSASQSEPNAIRIGFDDLDLEKLADIAQVTEEVATRLPAKVSDLEGKNVVIRGFMKPQSIPSGIPEFILVRDTSMCCFGPIAKVFHSAVVYLRPGTTTEYIEKTPFDVIGRFRIEFRQTDDGMVWGLYVLDDAQISKR
jgi:hypothetical protein